MAAVQEQLELYTHTAFQVMAYEPYVALAERLNALAPIEGAAKTILFSTGEHAEEIAGPRLAVVDEEEPGSLHHSGAGRKLGRKAAISSITKKQRDEYLKARGVTLLGGGLDESPQAYKDIETVIEAQDELITVLGKFTPKIVKMASEAGDV